MFKASLAGLIMVCYKLFGLLLRSSPKATLWR